MQAICEQSWNIQVRPIKLIEVIRVLGAVIAMRFPMEPARYVVNTRELQCDHVNTLCVGVSIGAVIFKRFPMEPQ